MRQDFFDLQRHRFATRKMMSHMPGMIGNPSTLWENDQWMVNVPDVSYPAYFTVG
jgi:hypothetical protein